MQKSKKRLQQVRPEKEIRVPLCFMLVLYIQSLTVLERMQSVTDRQTDMPNPICPLSFFEVWSIIMPNFNKIIYTLAMIYKSNIMILAETVLEIFNSQGLLRV